MTLSPKTFVVWPKPVKIHEWHDGKNLREIRFGDGDLWHTVDWPEGITEEHLQRMERDQVKYQLMFVRCDREDQ